MLSEEIRNPDPAGIVRRGEDAKDVQGHAAMFGNPPPCCVGSMPGRKCKREASMQVFGILLCEVHGEEAADGALEEMDFELEQELQRPMNPHVRPLSPHLEAALKAGRHSLAGLRADHERGDDLLLEAFPLDRSKVCAETLAYVEDPDPAARDFLPPFDECLQDRLLVCRHMRLAFEEGARWLVEVLEEHRAYTAAQAAYALALERGAGLR